MAAFAETESGYDIYSTDGYFWWPDGSRELVAQTPPTDGVLSWSLADLIGRCFYGVGAAYRRELFADLGGYRIGIFGEDYDFWLRAMASGARHRYLPEALSLHRITAYRKSADVERAYRSDIAILSDLKPLLAFSSGDREAIDHSILERQALIAQARSPVFRLKQRARMAIGYRRARALRRLVRSVSRQPRSR
jgi:GT2 family glycosyltransferase